MQNQFGILAMIQQGYYATYPLLFISVVCLAIIFERLWALRGIGSKAARTADSLIPQLRGGKFNEALQATQARSNPSERVYHTLISASQTLDREHLVDLDDERRYQEGLELKRYIWVLATAGASAPFIGLFGTVVGILVAFQSMAIVAVIFYNYFSVKVENINAILHINADRLIDAALQGRQAHGH